MGPENVPGGTSSLRNQDRFQNKSTILSRISEGWAVRGRYADAAIGASRAAGQGLVGDAIQGPIEAAKGWNEGESIGAGHKEPFAAAPAGAGRRHSARHCRRVLVADGDAAGRSSLRQMLREWGFEVVTAKNGEEALSILEQERPPDLAILRQMLPGIDGLEVSRRASEIASENAPYVFLLAREGGKQEIVRALEAGAQECLAAPVEEQELRARLLAAERILMRRDRLIRSRDEFRRQATKDALTGVWNRRGIVEILEREMKRGERFERPTGILLMDLDHFKSVNDTHGHLSGDLVLQEASRRLNNQLFRGRNITINEARARESHPDPAPGRRPGYPMRPAGVGGLSRPNFTPRFAAGSPDFAPNPMENGRAARAERRSRNFGADARYARRRRPNNGFKDEMGKKRGPIRERVGGQFFGGSEDDLELDDMSGFKESDEEDAV